MKKFLTISITLMVCIFSIGWNTPKEKTSEQKVKELLSKMTLEEKVGQMTQVTIQAISKTQGTTNQNHQLDLTKLEEAVVKYKVGSVLNVWDVAHSVEYWNEVISKIQDAALNKTKLKIPVLYGIDAIHGATYTKGSTLFPQSIGMAATFNTDLIKKAGEITAAEIKASGISWNFNPVMDIGRQPLWPRLWETFGEDVYLAQQMGKNLIIGQQQSGYKVAVCLKHFAGYGLPMNGKDRTPAWISERMMKEYVLPPFQAGIDAGAPTIMVNSGEVDGIPSHSDYHLLTEILRNEMKFKGFVVSDWEDIKRLYTRDKVADSPEEAVRMAVMAGVDMSMVPYDFTFYDILLKLVKDGKVPMKRIDEAVSRILKVKFDLGLFDNPYQEAALRNKFATEESKNINQQAANESIILVKNDNNILPLSKDKKILVTGPTANMLSVLNGGWTITWQGNEETLYPQEKNTVLEAVIEKVGKDNVKYVEGTGFDKDINTVDAVNSAKDVDVVLLCLGEKAYCETPGNINDLTLDEAQLNLASELIKTGKPVIVLMLEGRPRIIRKIVDGSNAILVGLLPGMEGGNAAANILFGDANPSGKLPITYPKYPNAIYHYDYKPLENFDGMSYDPQWGFGYGLSYTTFSVSDLKIDKDKINKTDNIKVTVNVKNAGEKAGKEVVQLYLTDLYGSVSRPVKQLKGFKKVALNPGEVKTVEFTIEPEHLSFIGRDNKRIIEAGDFKVTVGNLEKSFSVK
ncbi:MAG TPA: glycoside hydrolase family 3 N-terminal domain-containing protein [Ignavibacteriaceae bacterium]|nr:glycoside hydrolase family 3 N-terminal domain-containing protein [Ignavibacteriaceae bacterium]